jgi:hypothetical protein
MKPAEEIAITETFLRELAKGLPDDERVMAG